MGEPMALNLLRAGTRLLVWNRSRAKAEQLAVAGAQLAETVEEVVSKCELVIVMLLDATAIDTVLGRTARGFSVTLRGRTLVNMATISPDYSMQLADAVTQAGGQYLEAPVSGSRKPAEEAQLVAMLAGDRPGADRIRPILDPMCRAVVYCGKIPNALRMKLTVNLFMIVMVTGLAEAIHFAKRLDLDLPALVAILDASPMASAVSRVKLAKMVADDLAPQAAIPNVLENNRLILDAARAASTVTPLISICHALYSETLALGHDRADMVAVLRALEERTAAARQ
jgi:3-hydroxyisobutyrate dehydrogenase